MNISINSLERLFEEFAEFIQAKDKKAFKTFAGSQYFSDEEKYKEEIYREGHDTIFRAKWKPEDVGTGRIHRTISEAIKTKVVYNGRQYDNNLINHWTIKDDFSKFKPNKSFEELLFGFYKGKQGYKNDVVFGELLNYGHPYNLVAYLFFIKDSNIFVPISQQRFDKIFELLGIQDFKTSNRASWENYDTFLDIVKQVRAFLRSQDRDTTLLDSHSFLWILGNQMQATFRSSPIESQLNVIESAEEDEDDEVAEEDDELSFPEGSVVFRLHRSKERNSALIKAAKEKHLKAHSELRCQACGFSFEDTYGDLGKGFIEAHHLLPISELTEETRTRIEDLAMVCSNCHRMLHRSGCLSLEELKTIIVRKEE